ncbi:hypothetical protein F4859DRAFT_508169 [Xylaria cf. heliscus]|nr:hypothetical protein F4859DRAFT_508169 [Xylaria cf. heliscus]
MATPADLVASPTTLPASITSPPTIQFTPPPECVDPAANWVVSKSGYVDLGSRVDYSDLLTCTVNHFGAPIWGDQSCEPPRPPKVTADGAVSYYSGCAQGYSTVGVTTRPGYFTDEHPGVHFDVTAYGIKCCPTQYDFKYGYTPGEVPRQVTSTVRDGVSYPVVIYPYPLCIATSVSQLSGKEITIKTWSNGVVWDDLLPQTRSWNYETDSVFAHLHDLEYTVFQKTHTCFEECDDWFTYWVYPPKVRPNLFLIDYPSDEYGTPGPWTATSPVETPSQSATGSMTDTPKESNTPAPGGSGSNNQDSSSPSSTAPTDSPESSTAPPNPTSGAITALAPSLSAALMIGVAVMMLS